MLVAQRQQLHARQEELQRPQQHEAQLHPKQGDLPAAPGDVSQRQPRREAVRMAGPGTHARGSDAFARLRTAMDGHAFMAENETQAFRAFHIAANRRNGLDLFYVMDSGERWPLGYASNRSFTADGFTVPKIHTALREAVSDQIRAFRVRWERNGGGACPQCRERTFEPTVDHHPVPFVVIARKFRDAHAVTLTKYDFCNRPTGEVCFSPGVDAAWIEKWRKHHAEHGLRILCDRCNRANAAYGMEDGRRRDAVVA